MREGVGKKTLLRCEGRMKVTRLHPVLLPLDGVQANRSIIMHMLSQVRVGMDLTRIVLPTFILEKRSLLEMYAEFLAHPDIFTA